MDISPRKTTSSGSRTMQSDLSHGGHSYSPPAQPPYHPSAPTEPTTPPSAPSYTPVSYPPVQSGYESNPNPAMPNPFIGSDSFNDPHSSQTTAAPTPIHPLDQPMYPDQPVSQPSSAPETRHDNRPNRNLDDDVHPKYKKMVYSILLLLIIGLLGTGGYYFWLRNSSSAEKTSITNSNTPSVQSIPDTKVPEKNNQPATAPSTLSLDKPNYFPIDIETATASSLTTLFEATAAKIPNDPANTRPIELIVTDNNNNPIAFSRFAKIDGLNLSADVMDNLEDDFSLFILRQPQSGRPRMGIAVELKNREALISSVRLEEPRLPNELDSLFMKTMPTIPVGEFKDGVYQGIPVRYINLNQTEDLSIDYTVSSSNLLIGTSKEVLRSIIDLNR